MDIHHLKRGIPRAAYLSPQQLTITAYYSTGILIDNVDLHGKIFLLYGKKEVKNDYSRCISTCN